MKQYKIMGQFFKCRKIDCKQVTLFQYSFPCHCFLWKFLFRCWSFEISMFFLVDVFICFFYFIAFSRSRWEIFCCSPSNVSDPARAVSNSTLAKVRGAKCPKNEQHVKTKCPKNEQHVETKCPKNEGTTHWNKMS